MMQGGLRVGLECSLPPQKPLIPVSGRTSVQADCQDPQGMRLMEGLSAR